MREGEKRTSNTHRLRRVRGEIVHPLCSRRGEKIDRVLVLAVMPEPPNVFPMARHAPKLC